MNITKLKPVKPEGSRSTSASLHKWIKLYGDAGSQHQQISEQQEELRKLRAELRRVSEERDILKKAAAFFAKESK